MLKIIFINSRFIMLNLYTMIFDIVGNLKTKCGNLDLLFRGIAKVGRKLELKQLLYGFTF